MYPYNRVLALKKKEILSRVTTRMNLENIMVSKITDTKRQILCIPVLEVPM